MPTTNKQVSGDQVSRCRRGLDGGRGPLATLQQLQRRRSRLEYCLWDSRVSRRCPVLPLCVVAPQCLDSNVDCERKAAAEAVAAVSEAESWLAGFPFFPYLWKQRDSSSS